MSSPELLAALRRFGAGTPTTQDIRRLLDAGFVRPIGDERASAVGDVFPPLVLTMAGRAALKSAGKP